MNQVLQNKLENAYKRIVALQTELNGIQQKHAEEIADLKKTLQETQKVAGTSAQEIKEARENARNSKERAKRLKRKIERLEQKKQEKVLTNSSHKNESAIPSIG